jgi:signal transduction histidine kinase
MVEREIKILLIDDDEDDYVLTRGYLEEIEGWQLELDWIWTYEAALDSISRQEHDVYLLDYHLGDRTGLDLLRRAIADGCTTPMILLTGQGDHEVDLEAMRIGAADYLIKSNIDAHFLERSIRYAIKRKQSEEELRAAHDELRRTNESLERAQASAAAAEKLAAIGRLTAGVSHEILNPLNVIIMRLFMLLGDPTVPEAVGRHLKTMEEQANRISNITQDLLYFSRQRAPERQPIDLNEKVQRALNLMEHDLELRNIEVELKLSEGLPHIPADRGQVQQVVLNLLTNARDAMPEGGRLTLTSDLVRGNGGRCVELRVEDTGCGVEPEDMDKLFDPFFTTKPEGKGTGLGLSICQGIVDAHEGSLWAESQDSRGMAFVIHLPVDFKGREAVKGPNDQPLVLLRRDSF